ncbi:MAG: hypothetical protein M1820_001159 [Bogoriella megaspora]|nr:MAG: hypothetical protein M1820_001159 [Bogoriella megaspora]
MARKARQRISYVLPLTNSARGHRLGVNGLAVDTDRSVLYSGGRDGVICAWDINFDLRDPFESAAQSSQAKPATTLRQQVQAHTHWINDIALVENNNALASASSDITVKVWRPAAQDPLPPQSIGVHTDYVKRIASPGGHAAWVASGGLDRTISLWDLNGGGQKLEIPVADEGAEINKEKGSVYALATTDSVLASGGPESIVRIWDPRTGKRITKFVGHTDNIRDILINKDGDKIMTASSDQTVKVWSMTAGRCMYTLTMHDASVWCLFSDDSDLSVFYSGDKSGLIAKTDVRRAQEMDEGLAVAVAQEHEGIGRLAIGGDYIWTATSSSSINRWADVDTTNAEVQLPQTYRMQRASVVTTRSSRYPSPPQAQEPTTNGSAHNQVSFKSVLRLSNTAPFPAPHSPRTDDASSVFSPSGVRKTSEAGIEADLHVLEPLRSLPDHTVEGQNGLIKHIILNDRRRILTLDTAGEVLMWDLVKCVPIKSFGKRHLEDVRPEVDTTESIAPWCAVNTRTGSVTCVLEPNTCFDAEMYADELEYADKMDFREDQRINLGKWVLRYLFSNVIDEEIKRDESYRRALLSERMQPVQRINPPTNIQLPDRNLNTWSADPRSPTMTRTPRPPNGGHITATTPGLSIGVVTPSTSHPMPNSPQTNRFSTQTDEGSRLEKTASHHSQPRSSHDRSGDYFSSLGSIQTSGANGISSPTEAQAKGPLTPGGTQQDDSAALQSPTDSDKDGQSKEGMFGKKFRLHFGMKKLGKKDQSDNKPAVVDEKAEDSDSKSTKTDEKVVEDNFLGVVQNIRHAYDEEISAGGDELETGVIPSLPNDTPVLKPPANTIILIQQERPEAGGVADLLEGTVGSIGTMTDLVEKVGPTWLGNVLLRNEPPVKDVAKLAFTLEPYQGLLPSVSSEGLNANRMLRARKVLAYVAERVEPQSEHIQPDAMKPEEYLELYCQGQLLSPTITLASIKAYIWRSSSDMVLVYKANGRKEIKHAPNTTRSHELSSSRDSTASGQESGWSGRS